MPFLDSNWVMTTLLLAPPLLLSLTLHEYAHARTALAFGDPTAKHMGRVTLNPLAHLDPIGTLVLLFTRMIGWAKPVPVNPANLHPPGFGDICVSLAGPMTNLLLALASGGSIRLLAGLGAADHYGVMNTVLLMLTITMHVNITLCVFNLIPLFPLDGHHILRELLPVRHRWGYMRWQMARGQLVLVVLIFGPHLVGILTNRAVPSPLRYIREPVVLLIERIFGLDGGG